jgi:RHH-type rel operon transcriptional repressor/antitoxin RelB
MQEDDMSVAVSVRIPPALAKRLNSIARETERSRSFVIQKALEAYLEDYADLQIALDRLRDTADPVVSGAELRKAIGL